MFRNSYTDKLIEQFRRDGYVVIPDFFRDSECDDLKETSFALAEKLVSEHNKTIFSTNQEEQLKDKYFLESNDKIRPFYEKNAYDEKTGEFLVEPRQAMNKIGHALHLLHPRFRCYTYCDRVKNIVQYLRFEEPAVVQSMVIFKNPRVSSEVQPHQDATYLYTDPTPVVGFWIALEDATIENGCLWVISGSHRSGVHRRLMRDPNEQDKLVYDRPPSIYPESRFTALPVSKGSCILIHGHVVHKSSVNTTDKSRLAYTFHVAEKKNNIIAPENWLLEGPAAPFDCMYEVEQIISREDSSEEQGSDVSSLPQ